jgi:hypothetical protein
MKKQVICLFLLLTVLTVVISAQIINRDKLPEPVPQAWVDGAKSTVDMMLEHGRNRNWKAVEQTWAVLPSQSEAKDVLNWIGKDFSGEFCVLGSDFDEKAPGQIIIYGNFESSEMLEVTMKKNDAGFQIVSIKSI